MENFSNKMWVVGPGLGFTPAELTALAEDKTALQWIIVNMIEAYRTSMQELTAYKNILKDGPIGSVLSPIPTMPPLPAPGPIPAAGIVPRLRAMVQRIKTSPAYTNAIGEDLGIVAPEVTIETITAKPKCKAIALPNSEVRIEFVKGNYAGVLVEGKRGTGGWELLGRDNFSPYLDARPPQTAGQPEKREYRLRYLDGDEPVGEYSDVLMAVTKP